MSTKSSLACARIVTRETDKGACEDERYLAARAAWLYFNCDLRQVEVAHELGLSLNKVNRLIAAAQLDGTVRITVEGPIAECVGLEQALAERFGLYLARVVPQPHRKEASLDGLGRMTSAVIAEIIRGRHHGIVGVGGGRTLAAAIPYVRPVISPEMTFVSVLGFSSRHTQSHPIELIQRIAERTGGRSRSIPAPAYARSVQDRAILTRQSEIRMVLDQAARATLFLVGVGSMTEPQSGINEASPSKSDVDRAKRSGAVCEVFGRFFDRHGRLVGTSLNKRVVGVELEAVRGKQTIAVAAGTDKVAAILSGLRTGLLNGLLTTERTAQLLLAVDRPGFSGGSDP